MYHDVPTGSRILVPKTRFGSRMAVEFSAAILLERFASILLERFASILRGEAGSSRRPLTTTLAQFKRRRIILSIDIIAHWLLYITRFCLLQGVSAAIIKQDALVPGGSDQTAVQHWPLLGRGQPLAQEMPVVVGRIVKPTELLITELFIEATCLKTERVQPRRVAAELSGAGFCASHQLAPNAAAAQLVGHPEILYE